MVKELIQLLLFCMLGCALPAKAQPSAELLQTELKPYRINGRQNPFSRKLSFSNYKTLNIKRSASSFTSLGTVNLLNPILIIETIPLQRKDKYKIRDRFRFTMKKENDVVFTVECRELLAINEKFRFFRSQDSSFFGSRNTDFLTGVIVPATDTANRWILTATNLNTTNNAEQKGILICGKDEITFTVTNLMLRERYNPSAPETNFSSLNMVYAFTYKNEIVAALSVKEARRKFWVSKNIDEKVKDAIAAVSAILVMRRNLYR
jgi:hypothetical protein